MIHETVKEYIEKLEQIENEISLLREDKKILDADFKEKLDLKAVKAALRIAKIREKVHDKESVVDQVLTILEE